MALKRYSFQSLKNWYDSPLRGTPCVIFGARQVGKSTIAMAFAQSTGRDIFNINFWKDPDEKLKKIFSFKRNAGEIIQDLEIYFNRSLHPEKVILILDEIQECPAAYSLCKTFKEDCKIPIIATGSYLKLFLYTQEQAENPIALPIGCTHEIQLTPLCFAEFLENIYPPLFARIKKESLNEIKIDDFLHQQLLKAYYEYLFVGGMPEAVNLFLQGRESNLFETIKQIRSVQKNIISGHENDFLYFAQKKIVISSIASKLHHTFKTIAKELNRHLKEEENVTRFKYKDLGEHIQFSKISNVFEYLHRTGLIIRSFATTETTPPLLTKLAEKNYFKCYYFDVGILNAQLDLTYENILENKINFYKGPIAENFIAQEVFHYTEGETHYWKLQNYEIDFLLDFQGEIIPLEIKSSKRNTKSVSLEKFLEKYRPKNCYKISPNDLKHSEGQTLLPIYFLFKIFTR